MAAYDISDNALTAGCQSSSPKLPTVWKYVPEHISFGRVLHVFHESAIVTLYEGKVRFVYPEMDNPEPNAKTLATYQVCDYFIFHVGMRTYWMPLHPVSFSNTTQCQVSGSLDLTADILASAFPHRTLWPDGLKAPSRSSDASCPR